MWAKLKSNKVKGHSLAVVPAFGYVFFAILPGTLCVLCVQFMEYLWWSSIWRVAGYGVLGSVAGEILCTTNRLGQHCLFQSASYKC